MAVRRRAPKRLRPHVTSATRHVLLLGTALASTFLVAGIATPTPARAQETCPPGVFPPPGPIGITTGAQAIDCDNVFDRENNTGDVIQLHTTGALHAVDLYNSGDLTATGDGDYDAIEVFTYGADSEIVITNTGELVATEGRGIKAYSQGTNSPVTVTNTGHIVSYRNAIYARSRGGSVNVYNDARIDTVYSGIQAFSYGYAADSAVRVINTGDIITESENTVIAAVTRADTSGVYVKNSGKLVGGIGILALTGSSGGGDFSPIEITNTGDIEAHTTQAVNHAIGIDANTGGGPSFHRDHSPITITNTGEIGVSSSGNNSDGFGIRAYTLGVDSGITITNRGGISVRSQRDAYGIYAVTDDDDSAVTITNTTTIDVRAPMGETEGINVFTDGEGSKVSVTNSGNITSIARDFADAIDIYTDNDRSSVVVTNTGALFVRGNGDENRGIEVDAYGDGSPITITNSATISVGGGGDDMAGIFAGARGSGSPVKITNSGAFDVTSSDGDANGIEALVYGPGSGVTIVNTGMLRVDADDWSDGIDVESIGGTSPISIINTGDIVSTARQNGAEAIDAFSLGDKSPITVDNSGALTTKGGDYAYGIFTETVGNRSAISITNRGNLDVTATREYATGIYARTYWDDSPILITNSGDITARTSATEYYATGIWADSGGLNSPVTITNSGSVYAEGALSTGIFVYSYYANKTTITNTGEIGASSHLAIDVYGQGTATIFNAGHITGYVKLTEQNDRFVNRAGGIFETKKTSRFGGGEDVFSNQAGATVLAATDASKRESSGFRGLETFKNNGGTISLVDGGVGDKFTIANTPGSADLKFEGGGYLAVDASLRGSGSKADNFIVDGDVSGQTKVMVNNTSTLPGVFNSQGIPVVFVEGQTPKEGNFVMADGPIDTGLFDYDLYFVPTGSGYWELRSFVGASAHMLPKLLTAAQDLWHETSSTWFDRTADLRVVLNGGGAPAYDAGSKSMAEPGGNGLTPGVWIKGGGSRLDRNGSATTRAYGNTYNYDLDSELSTVDLQMGVDMGKYDVLSEGDVLVFGVLGGFVGAGLDYDSLADSFNFSGGQVGAYATYLKDGLFVDTLLNVHLYEIDTPNLGFPDSLNATTVGLRTDAGYRFGSFTGGAFFEPLATIEIAWADIDGFNVGGNAVSFSDDANVRGRIGGRVGTTTEAWEGTMMEPFLIASLWGNLADDNAATLVSSGTTFQFQDDLDDVWGELSAGVNLFNFSQTTAVFAKVDYTFGEDVQGLGGKAGMRVAW